MNRNIARPLLLAAFLAAYVPSFAQFTPQEVAEREKWEEFLATARVIAQEQMSSRDAVTSPWVLTLEKDGRTHRALWKDPEGRVKGFVENWRWEIAAYRLDKYLGLNMIPPTVEKILGGTRGSCQLWVESRMSLREKTERGIATPPDKAAAWLRTAYLQQAFDNLIANEDRHQGNVLVTEDWRAILIDHSRTFRTSRKFRTRLIHVDAAPEAPTVMLQLPRRFVDRLGALNPEILKSIAGNYLTAKEMEAVLLRRGLLLRLIASRIRTLGEDEVLYDCPPRMMRRSGDGSP